MTPEDWRKLRSAGVAQVALIVALGIASVVLNGLLWRQALRPVRPLPRADTISVNALATVLAYLPFKPSVILRVAYHHRFDHVPIMLFGGWAAAVGIGMIAGLGPGVLAATIPELRANLPLLLLSMIAGAGFAGCLVITIARTMSHGMGWRLFRRSAAALFGRRAIRVLRSTPVRHLHASTRMLASPADTMLVVTLRLLDAGTIALRFALVASILGTPLQASQALVLGITYFVVGTAAPTGTAGVREGAAAGVLALLHVEDSMPVILLVGAAQVIGDLITGALALAWLGPRRILRLRRSRD